MIRRATAQIILCLTIVFALVSVAPAKTKHHQVRRATPADDDAEVSVAYQTRELDSNVVPTTRAASVLVEDAKTGEVLYEKNADATRAAASTQKLLTALIIAEDGYLDREVTVQTTDTLAEPVRLNIKPGDTY